MLAVDGPLLGYFMVPIMLLYSRSKGSTSGLLVVSDRQFWLGAGLAMMYQLTSLVYMFVYIPAVRVWYDNRILELNPYSAEDEEPVAPIDDEEGAEFTPQDDLFM